MNIQIDPLYQYICEVQEELTFENLLPHYDSKLCSFNQGNFFFLEKNSNSLIRINIFTNTNNKIKMIDKFSVKDISGKILFIIKLDKEFILILTDKKVYEICMEKQSLELRNILDNRYGKIICFDFSFTRE